MKELAQNILQDLTIRAISRYGVLGENEVVAVGRLPRRGVTVSHMDVEGIRTAPTPDVTVGLFTIASRSGGKFTLENRVNRIRITGVPRKSIQKLLESDPFERA